MYQFNKENTAMYHYAEVIATRIYSPLRATLCWSSRILQARWRVAQRRWSAGMCSSEMRAHKRARYESSKVANQITKATERSPSWESSGPQIVKKFSVFYTTGSFIAMLTTDLHWSILQPDESCLQWVWNWKLASKMNALQSKVYRNCSVGCNLLLGTCVVVLTENEQTYDSYNELCAHRDNWCVHGRKFASPILLMFLPECVWPCCM